nr:6830_t:CDS:10 [Entrophospora candida]
MFYITISNRVEVKAPRKSIDDIIEAKRNDVKVILKTDDESDDDNDDDDAIIVESNKVGNIINNNSKNKNAIKNKTKNSKKENVDSSDSSGEDDEFEKERKKEYFSERNDFLKDIEPADSFQTMNLSRPILKGLSQLGFVEPTPIQKQSIPIALMGKDICGGAITGSGKTVAFLVPVLERLLYRPRQMPTVRVLVIIPTRELGIQCHSVATKLAKFIDINICLCVGGLNLKKQENELKKRPDIVIATPGRLIDHVRNSPSFTLETIEILILDEADRMLEDGFADELNEIIKNCPKSRQTMLFSATMTDNIDQLIKLSLSKPVRLMVDSAKSTSKNLVHEFIRIRQNKENDKAPILLLLCSRIFKSKVIVFFKSKALAHEMKIIFGLFGLKASELHGGLTQEQRLVALELFRSGEVDFLLATDLASRGLDIKGIETVINHDIPNSYQHYVHRVGRTARAGRNGHSVTLTCESDRKLLKQIIKHTIKDQIRRRTVDAKSVQELGEKLKQLKSKINEVLKEEKEEK